MSSGSGGGAAAAAAAAAGCCSCCSRHNHEVKAVHQAQSHMHSMQCNTRTQAAGSTLPNSNLKSQTSPSTSQSPLAPLLSPPVPVALTYPHPPSPPNPSFNPNFLAAPPLPLVFVMTTTLSSIKFSLQKGVSPLNLEEVDYFIAEYARASFPP